MTTSAASIIALGLCCYMSAAYGGSFLDKVNAIDKSSGKEAISVAYEDAVTTKYEVMGSIPRSLLRVVGKTVKLRLDLERLTKIPERTNKIQAVQLNVDIPFDDSGSTMKALAARFEELPLETSEYTKSFSATISKDLNKAENKEMKQAVLAAIVAALSK